MSETNISDWLALLIALAALCWTILESIHTRRAFREQEQLRLDREKQAEYVRLLDDFLMRLKTVLSRSRRDFDALMTGEAGRIRRLEYYPATLRTYFESLPDDRRLFWERDIRQLQLHNDDAIRLIDEHASGTLVSPAFQEACERFRAHASRWKDRWDAITGSTINTNDLPSDLMADPFPENFDALVDQEVASVRKAANRLPPSRLTGEAQCRH